MGWSEAVQGPSTLWPIGRWEPEAELGVEAQYREVVAALLELLARRRRWRWQQPRWMG